ncbi:uncharacterized protein KNAG_0H01740 [Huiozyma naganishii CBS 8797]|uniref:Secreted protein CSS2 C-terminal domain-containing protein n=1 Tax=Huiozyma naganishii (strain ATCC MYA-139 / BCRC 22969 / CBS 8797 / KCTC 17520 / NBRC 10181 / NCYC 3082 / Yp74L-3) TaxID=1071383 RepID=J7S8K2_HUIN7|nr:hypothetical protein KNAG_0H01740 [Kazachstania naganishii CBS 8797]CCK71589.1 hypothetical protein KNAG_0H01740 [Kazachstania naganishii CBS 8797]
MSQRLFLTLVNIIAAAAFDTAANLEAPVEFGLIDIGNVSFSADPRFTSGHLTTGAPLVVYQGKTDINTTLLPYPGSDYQPDLEGIQAFVDKMNSPHYDGLATRDYDLEGAQSVTVAQVLDLLAMGRTDRDNLGYKRDDCNNGYWHNFTNKLFRAYNRIDEKLASNVLQFTWSLATSVLGEMSGYIQLGQQSAANTKAASQPHQCAGRSDWLNYDASDGKCYTYWVGVAPWTTGPNCDTTAREDLMASAFAFAYETLNQVKGTSMCVSMTHDGTWHADVRIARWEEAQFCGINLWSIPCDDANFVYGPGHDEL